VSDAPLGLSRWDAVLFDLDGTLADTVPLILASWRHAMTVHRGAPLPDELWLAQVGRPLRESLREFARDEEEAAAIRRIYEDFQREAHDHMVTPFPGIQALVAELEAAGTPMALVTSKAREMALRTLSVCGLSDAFPVVITADEVVRGKPDPEPVELALREMGLGGMALRRTAPGGMGVVFVGDSPHDVVAGRRASVRTVGVTWGAAPREALVASGPDYLVDEVVALGSVSP
jgi:pyrophosphatase PpaX